MSVPEVVTEPIVRDVRPIPQGVVIDISLPVELFYFQGHFPGRPILPGVVQIDWVVRLADKYLETTIESAQSFQVKFKSVIEPGRSLTLVLRRASDDRKLLFEYQDGSAVLSSGSVGIQGKP